MKKFVFLTLAAIIFFCGVRNEKVLENAELVPYKGPVYHVFFHSLVLEPEAAFFGSNSRGFNMWMTTRDEFYKILDNLYRNGFVLVRLGDFILKTKDKVSRAYPLLPRGKKALVISVDDVNYYEYMRGRGFAQRLVLDREGNLAAEVENKLDYRGDVMLCLEDFLKRYPDFSYRGARGIIALTAFEGVLGYKNIESDPREAKEAKRAADALKALGWEFACHSYGHGSGFKDGSISLPRLMRDTQKFKKATEDIIGSTNIYIPPFGMPLGTKDARMKYLKSQGFDIYCPVDSKMSFFVAGGVLISGRLNIDGLTMQRYPERLSGLFCAKDVIDPKRPKIN